MHRPSIGFGAVAIVLVSAACGPIVGGAAAAPGVPTRTPGTLTGTLRLVDPGVERTATSCHGTGRYSDVGPGMNVSVRDGKGSIIGTAGTVPAPVATEGAAATCELRFEVGGLPGARRYSLSVGGRFSATYSKQALDAAGWHVELTLGS